MRKISHFCHIQQRHLQQAIDEATNATAHRICRLVKSNTLKSESCYVLVDASVRIFDKGDKE